MIEDERDESKWHYCIRQHFPAIVSAGHEALGAVGSLALIRAPKARRIALTDVFSEALVRYIPGAYEVPSGGGDFWVVIPELAIVRVKSADTALRVRNLRTRRHALFLENGELPGIPATIPRIELCYVMNRAGDDIVRLSLTQRNEDGILVLLDLPWGDVKGSGTVALELELPKTIIRPKRSDRADREGTNDS
ncbi:MAG: hypothetical protein ACK5N1_03905 [Gemmatimonas sp.]|uniref:hypothetical protein n=1 Tax=Gemmatimonas sp. TaxID=1962908 RepID=UPI00391F878F